MKETVTYSGSIKFILGSFRNWTRKGSSLFYLGCSHCNVIQTCLFRVFFLMQETDRISCDPTRRWKPQCEEWGGGRVEWGGRREKTQIISKKTMDFWMWLIPRQISAPPFHLVHSTHPHIRPSPPATHPCFYVLMYHLSLIVIHHSRVISCGSSEHRGL